MTVASQPRRRPLALGALVALLAALLASCAATPEPKAPRYESAEHKNLVLFLRAYQDAWNSRNEIAILRMYGAKSREAPLLFPGGRTLGDRELAESLPEILRVQGKANLRQEILSPIEYDVAGDAASVACIVRVSYEQSGESRQGYIRRTLSLRREKLFWNRAFSHFEFVPAEKIFEGMSSL